MCVLKSLQNILSYDQYIYFTEMYFKMKVYSINMTQVDKMADHETSQVSCFFYKKTFIKKLWKINKENVCRIFVST